jgi:hypothetical protein
VALVHAARNLLGRCGSLAMIVVTGDILPGLETRPKAQYGRRGCVVAESGWTALSGQTLEADIHLYSGAVSVCLIWDLRRTAANWQSWAESGPKNMCVPRRSRRVKS